MKKKYLNILTLCSIALVLLIALLSSKENFNVLNISDVLNISNISGLSKTEFSLEVGKNMKTVDYVDIKLVNETVTLYVGNGCDAILMLISNTQARSIQEVLENETFFRPNTHDLFVSTSEHFKIEMLRIEITKLENNAYFAKLFLKKGNRVLELDARPSDSIALALRTNTPIYVNQSLLQEQGIDLC